MINKNPHLIHHNALKAIKPAMRYNGGEPFADWQKRARARLWSVL